MALNLQYRSTFIDVEEKSTEGQKVRARSLPPTGRVLASEVQEEETQLSNYVVTLAQRAEQLCVLLRRDGNLAQLKEEPAAAAEVEQQQQKFKHQRMRSDASSTAIPHETSELASLSSRGGDQPQSPMVQRPTRRDAFGSGVTSLAGLLEEVMPTPGSVGHPEVCRRPCIYFAAGTCSNGAACGYCHMPHTQRPVHLDKHQREALKQMDEAELLKIIARQLHSRATCMGFQSEAGEVLGLMDAWAAAAAQVPVKAKAAPRPRQLERLEYHMSRMTFSSLLSLAGRGQKSGASADLEEAVAGALARMRERLAQAGIFELQARQ